MDPIPFVYELTIRLHDTDSAGVLFFGHLFRHIHDAYESFMAEIGFPLHELIRPDDPESGLALPIVHAQADYLRPLCQGSAVRIALRVAELRNRSFALDYLVEDASGLQCARARTVHALAGRAGADRPRLPERLRLALLARMGDRIPAGGDPGPGHNQTTGAP
jgi:1,4-dihydroxy-2-naphthoyl-CoA hydrolase